MPRIRQNAEEYAKADLKKAFLHGLVEADKPNAKAVYEAAKMGLSYPTFMRRMAHPEEFTLAELRRLLPLLPVPEGEIQKFIGG